MSLLLRILLSTSIGIICGTICSNLANKYRKNQLLWFQMGFFFGILGILFFYIKLFIDKTRGPRLAGEAVLVSGREMTLEPPPQKIEDKTKTTLESRDWYYLDAENKQMGPISFKELKVKVEEGVLNEKSLLWSEGMESWEPLSKLAYLKLVLTS